MKFIKMHGLGNDFVMVNTFVESAPENLSEFAKKACDRRFGVGADGLILIMPSEKADLKMRIINADGSEAEMCGNGIRCFALLAYELGLVSKNTFDVETLAGIIKPQLIFDDELHVLGVRVDMGVPRLVPREIPVKLDGERVVNRKIEFDNQEFYITTVSMGNPHCVIFVDSVSETPVATLGPHLEKHDLFPNRTNVEFIEVVNPKEIKMRVWERGAAETLACGTGACAATVAAVLNAKTERKITVHLQGGQLEVEWAENNHVYMTGPAEKVFAGELFI